MKKVVVLLLFVFSACTSSTEIKRNQTVGNALGTTYSIIYLSDKTLDYSTAIDSIFNAVNQSMSTYWSDSDISKINRGDSLLQVDHMFKDVFELSKKIHLASNGYFDPTVGTLVNAWGFGPGKQIAMDSTKVDSLLNYVGFNKVTLTPEGTIKKVYPNIYFDFNAIAKGYAIDRLGLMLEEKGIQNYLVEVGGEVLTKGENIISEKPWTVGIDDPTNLSARGSGGVLKLKNGALASSGNYRKFRVDTITGEKYVHTINPKTGFTKNSKVLAASVIAKDCATADAYATTFMAMDLKETKAFLNKNTFLEAYIIYLDELGNTQKFLTQGFAEKMKP